VNNKSTVTKPAMSAFGSAIAGKTATSADAFFM